MEMLLTFAAAGKNYVPPFAAGQADKTGAARNEASSFLLNLELFQLVLSFCFAYAGSNADFTAESSAAARPGNTYFWKSFN